MSVTGQPVEDPKDRLLHSIHNTTRTGVKLALVQSSKYDAALGQFANLQNILTNCVDPKYHSSVFVSGSSPKLSGRQVDSISSGNYSSYTDSLLTAYNPQTGDEKAPEYVPPVVKSYRPAVLTYAQAAAPTLVPSVIVPSAPPALSSVSNNEVDKMFAVFSQKFSASLGSSLSIQALEKQVQQTSGELHEVKATFQTQIQTVITQNAAISTNMENLTNTISRQNFIIACIQQEFKETMSDLYSKLGLPLPDPKAQVAASTAPQPAATPLALQLGGARA